MKSLNINLFQAWRRISPSLMPFSDVATKDLPLSKWLRLALFQVSVGMATVMLIGTLNRVMIVELEIMFKIVNATNAQLDVKNAQTHLHVLNVQQIII